MDIPRGRPRSLSVQILRETGYIVEVGNSHKTSAGSRTTLLYRRVLKQIEACVAVSTSCFRAQESFTVQGLSATL